MTGAAQLVAVTTLPGGPGAEAADWTVTLSPPGPVPAVTSPIGGVHRPGSVAAPDSLLCEEASLIEMIRRPWGPVILAQLGGTHLVPTGPPLAR